MTRRGQQLLCIGLLAVQLAFIWGNSAMPVGVSGAASGSVLRFLTRCLPLFRYLSEFGIRKIAHFTEFACLGLLLGWLCRLRKLTGVGSVTAPALAGLLAACVDETIQRYVPGRDSTLPDVWLDFCGAVVGLTVLRLVCRRNHQ